MKNHKYSKQPKQLSFSFDLVVDQRNLVGNKQESLTNKKASGLLLDLNKVLEARKVNKNAEMYLRILESVKHIA